MDKQSKPSAAPSPESFSLYVLPGETFVCGINVTTPRAPYLVQCTSEELTPEILQSWFLQSIVPLVGEEAKAALEQLMASKADLTNQFLNKALIFRQSLK